MTRFGVSPAFVVSLSGTHFSPADYCAALPRARDLGFSAFQPELYREEALPEWEERGAREVQRMAEDLGLYPSQFVAHFMIAQLADFGGLAGGADTDLLRRVLDVARVFSGCRVLTIPSGPFQADAERVGDPEWHAGLERRLREKILRWLDIVSGAGWRLAFEIIPGSVFGSFGRFMELAKDIGSPDLGLNLDTGHAWAMREPMELLPMRLAGRVFGLHLKDNDSDHNRPLGPGRGTIPWTGFLKSLAGSGYDGSLDIEIGCGAGEVEEEYAAARHHLERVVAQIGA